jgi:hypothetical protein
MLAINMRAIAISRATNTIDPTQNAPEEKNESDFYFFRVQWYIFM